MTPLSSTAAAGAENSSPKSDLKLLNPPQQTSPGGTGSVPASLHDIYGPLEPVSPPPYLLYALCCLVPLLLGAALFWWVKKRKNMVSQPIPPGTAARSDLMLARELMTEETALPYLEKISEILRNYIESRFSLALTRQTTSEFLRSLATAIPADHVLVPFKKELKHCLETCDMAKFAHHPVTLDHLREMEQTLLDFINISEPDGVQGNKKGEK